MGDIKIVDKPVYCHCWTPGKNFDPDANILCNAIPCCGWYIHGRKDRVTDGFKDVGKIGKNQAPDYNDLRKKNNEFK